MNRLDDDVVAVTLSATTVLLKYRAPFLAGSALLLLTHHCQRSSNRSS